MIVSLPIASNNVAIFELGPLVLRVMIHDRDDQKTTHLYCSLQQCSKDSNHDNHKIKNQNPQNFVPLTP